MRTLLTVTVLVLAVGVRAQPPRGAPQVVRAVPEEVAPAALDELKTLALADTALPVKTKQLIALGVAAQLPCRSCVYATSQLARSAGASDRELREAIAMAAITRHWGTVIDGSTLDPAELDRELPVLINFMKTSGTGTPIAPAEPITDAASAYRDIERTFGSVPSFIGAFPVVAIAPAWRELKDLELNQATQLDGRTKELIGLAVAAQIPCRFCVALHAELARMNGASDDELKEAVAMAALSRQWATILAGSLEDDAQVRRAIDQLVRALRDKKRAAVSAQR
jgi:AhpD family alkylhydroperoxidase